jgi:hypothetical protein
MAGPITAYTLAVATGASAIGPARSRLRGLGIYATAASTFTLTSGNGGGTLLTGAFPAGYNEVYIPDDGIIAARRGICFCVYWHRWHYDHHAELEKWQSPLLGRGKKERTLKAD